MAKEVFRTIWCDSTHTCGWKDEVCYLMGPEGIDVELERSLLDRAQKIAEEHHTQTGHKVKVSIAYERKLDAGTETNPNVPEVR